MKRSKPHTPSQQHPAQAAPPTPQQAPALLHADIHPPTFLVSGQEQQIFFPDLPSCGLLPASGAVAVLEPPPPMCLGVVGCWMESQRIEIVG